MSTSSLSKIQQGDDVVERILNLSQVEALHLGAEYMTNKFGHSPGVYEKWRRWFLPACDADQRRQNISRRFEIDYRINVNDYERSEQPLARSIRRNIRQLLHRDYAPINNRIWHERLGQLLIEKSRVDLTHHLKRLEEREKHRQTELLQKGVIKQEDYDRTSTVEVSKRQIRRPKRTNKAEASKASTMLARFDKSEVKIVPPDLEKLRTKITTQQAILDENPPSSDTDVEPVALSPSVEWEAPSPTRKPRHKIFIPMENACPRDLGLLEVAAKFDEREVTSDELRWEEWIRGERLSSDNSGLILEDEPQITTPASMEELYTRAQQILDMPSFVRKQPPKRSQPSTRKARK